MLSDFSNSKEREGLDCWWSWIGHIHQESVDNIYSFTRMGHCQSCHTLSHRVICLSRKQTTCQLCSSEKPKRVHVFMFMLLQIKNSTSEVITCQSWISSTNTPIIKAINAEKNALFYNMKNFLHSNHIIVKLITNVHTLNIILLHIYIPLWHKYLLVNICCLRWDQWSEEMIENVLIIDSWESGTDNSLKEVLHSFKCSTCMIKRNTCHHELAGKQNIKQKI